MDNSFDYSVLSEVAEIKYDNKMLVDWSDKTDYDLIMYYPYHLTRFQLAEIDNPSYKFIFDGKNPFSVNEEKIDMLAMQDFDYFYGNIAGYSTTMTDINGNKEFKGSETDKVILYVDDSNSNFSFRIIFTKVPDSTEYTFRYEI